ncbi:MAG TPA: hypothetical protein ENJ18_12250 [Nannocystis exedens]|nr:hypothetical protein [Nannocystis exedens]
MRPERAIVSALVLALSAVACASKQHRALGDASEHLAREIRRADREGVGEYIAPSIRARVDMERLVAKPERGIWAKALAKPLEVRLEATLFIGPDRPVEITRGEEGWVFAEDPFVRWDQSSPRAALRTLVRASDEMRWDVLLELAPLRYRMGLAAQDLRLAWTEGEHAEALQAARDRLREHLADPIRTDSHEAALDLGSGEVVRLEREGSRWVIVDF